MNYIQSACGRQVHVRVAVNTTGGGGGGGGVERCVEYTDTKSYDKPRTGSPTQTQAWHTHTNTRAQIINIYIWARTRCTWGTFQASKASKTLTRTNQYTHLPVRINKHLPVRINKTLTHTDQ